MFYDGQWGTVCDDGWDMDDAKVVCHQLGFSFAVNRFVGGGVPSGSGPIWLDNVACTGEEENIAMCYHNGLGNEDCSHSEDAGVKCSNVGKARDECFVGSTSLFCLFSFFHTLNPREK